MYPVNAAAYANHELSVKAVPLEGPNSGKPFTFRSRESCKAAPGSKAVLPKGASVGPVTIVQGAAEPSWELKLSIADEAARFAKHLDPDGTSGLGAVGTRFNLTCVWTRKGLSTR